MPSQPLHPSSSLSNAAAARPIYGSLSLVAPVLGFVAAWVAAHHIFDNQRVGGGEAFASIMRFVALTFARLLIASALGVGCALYAHVRAERWPALWVIGLAINIPIAVLCFLPLVLFAA